MDLSEFQGIGQFGPDYELGLRNDTHAPDSVVMVLAERMVRLCPETARYLYEEHTPTAVMYRRGSRPRLERHAASATDGAGSAEERIEGICRMCAGLEDRAPEDLDSMEFGGTEEEVVARGSDWCTDVARVGCVLAQVLGLPARIVSLFDLSRAHTGHDIIEVYRSGVWGAVDPLNNVVYRHPDSGAATTWDLVNNRSLAEAHRRVDGTPDSLPGPSYGAAVSNYFVWDSQDYDYTVSGLNDYTRPILEMSERGWPGGRRWLHRED